MRYIAANEMNSLNSVRISILCSVDSGKWKWMSFWILNFQTHRCNTFWLEKNVSYLHCECLMYDNIVYQFLREYGDNLPIVIQEITHGLNLTKAEALKYLTK